MAFSFSPSTTQKKREMTAADSRHCSICLKDDDGTLIQPCKCSGGVCVGCLEQWIVIRPGSKDKCEVCLEYYSGSPPSQWWFIPINNIVTILTLVLCNLMIVTMVVGSAWLISLTVSIGTVVVAWGFSKRWTDNRHRLGNYADSFVEGIDIEEIVVSWLERILLRFFDCIKSYV